MDTIIDHYAREGHVWSMAQRVIESWGRTFTGQPYINHTDNHGNQQLGHTIQCANGDTVILTETEFLSDELTKALHAELIEYADLGATYSLGNIISPIEFRCQEQIVRSR